MKYYYFAQFYWEIDWFYSVYKKLGGELISPPLYGEFDIALERTKMPVTKTADITGTLIIAHQTAVHHEIIKTFLQAGGKVVVLQHAWDDELLIQDGGENYSDFTLYCVSSQEDYDMLYPKYKEKIVLTGSPKLDTTYEVKNKETVSDFSYDYIFGNPPVERIHTKETIDYYFKELPKTERRPILYKIHPGIDSFPKTYLVKYPYRVAYGSLFIADLCDPEQTVKLIKHSLHVVTAPSFLMVESALLDKDVYIHGNTLNLPPPISRFKETNGLLDRQDLFKRYLFDGKNTDRVVEAIKKL